MDKNDSNNGCKAIYRDSSKMNEMRPKSVMKEALQLQITHNHAILNLISTLCIVHA